MPSIFHQKALKTLGLWSKFKVLRPNGSGVIFFMDFQDPDASEVSEERKTENLGCACPILIKSGTILILGCSRQ